MARKLLRRLMPDPDSIKTSRSLRFLGKWLHDANLWHMNRRSVAKAIFIGFSVSFVPLPIHTIIASTLAIGARANLPVSLAAVWLSNPITIPAQFYLSYKLGTRLLGQAPVHFDFHLSLQWLSTEFAQVWQPLLLGCLVNGLVAGAIGATAVRLFWRCQVILRWRARQHRRGKH